MAIVHIGIGSNLGNRQLNCLEAVRLLKQGGLHIRKESPIIETKPWGVKEQANFFNMVIEAETGLSPSELLGLLKNTEAGMGRQESMRWGPRLIDLDILFYDDLVMDTPCLKIPHPHLHERDFVLRPLAEMAPDKIHPIFKKNIRELCDLPDGRQIEKTG